MAIGKALPPSEEPTASETPTAETPPNAEYHKIVTSKGTLQAVFEPNNTMRVGQITCENGAAIDDPQIVAPIFDQYSKSSQNTHTANGMLQWQTGSAIAFTIDNDSGLIKEVLFDPKNEPDDYTFNDLPKPTPIAKACDTAAKDASNKGNKR